MSLKAFVMPALRLSALVTAPMSVILEAAALLSQPLRRVRGDVIQSGAPGARCSTSAVWTGRLSSPYRCLRQRRCFGSTPATAFSLPQLPYAYDALSPYISAATLKIHHGKHHAAYISKLNGKAPQCRDACVQPSSLATTEYRRLAAPCRRTRKVRVS